MEIEVRINGKRQHGLVSQSEAFRIYSAMCREYAQEDIRFFLKTDFCRETFTEQQISRVKANIEDIAEGVYLFADDDLEKTRVLKVISAFLKE